MPYYIWDPTRDPNLENSPVHFNFGVLRMVLGAVVFSVAWLLRGPGKLVSRVSKCPPPPPKKKKEENLIKEPWVFFRVLNMNSQYIGVIIIGPGFRNQAPTLARVISTFKYS